MCVSFMCCLAIRFFDCAMALVIYMVTTMMIILVTHATWRVGVRIPIQSQVLEPLASTLANLPLKRRRALRRRSFSLQWNAFSFSLQLDAFGFSLQCNAFCFSLQSNAFCFSLQSNAFSFSLQLDAFCFSLQSNAFCFSLQSNAFYGFSY